MLDVLLERLWNTLLLVGAGQILAIAIGVIFANLIADLLYSYLDPRVRGG